MLGSGMNLITTIIGFGMSTTFIVFVCTRLICGRLRRIDDRQMFEMDTRIDLELQPEHRINGLEPVVVAAIPTMKFNREAFGSLEDAQCTICLEEYEEKEVLRIMPKCGHSFHLSCIDIWLRKQITCPVCRVAVQQNSIETKHIRNTSPIMGQSFDSSEITFDHSRQWFLPTITRPVSEPEGNHIDIDRYQTNADSISIQVAEESSGVSTEATIRRVSS